MRTIELPITPIAVSFVILILISIVLLVIILIQVIRPETEIDIELMDDNLLAKIKKLAERRIDAEYFYQAHVIEEGEYLKECADIDMALDDLKEDIEINDKK